MATKMWIGRVTSRDGLVVVSKNEHYQSWDAAQKYTSEQNARGGNWRREPFELTFSTPDPAESEAHRISNIDYGDTPEYEEDCRRAARAHHHESGIGLPGGGMTLAIILIAIALIMLKIFFLLIGGLG